MNELIPAGFARENFAGPHSNSKPVIMSPVSYPFRPSGSAYALCFGCEAELLKIPLFRSHPLVTKITDSISLLKR